jgi:type IV pilus assembly protein PilY1
MPPSSGGGSVLPNVLLLIDNSGSMTWDAYAGTYDETDGTYWYVPATRYDGIFDATMRYHYVEGTDFLDSRYFVEDSGGEWSGNFLNWAATARVDVCRMVLTGGKKVAYGTHYFMTTNSHAWVGVLPEGPFVRRYDDNSQATDFNGVTAYQTPYQDGEQPHFEYLRETCDFNAEYDGLKCGRLLVFNSSGSQVGEYFMRLEVDAGHEPTGVLHELIDEVNLGIMHFYMSEGGYIANYVRKFSGDHFNDVINHVRLDYGYWSTSQTPLNAEIKTTSTPLAESLYWATRYFAQQPNTVLDEEGCIYYAISPPRYELADDIAPWRDPLYDEDFGRLLSCANNYVCIITDGEPTSDSNIPTALRDFDGDGADPCPCGIDEDYGDCDCSTTYPFSDGGTGYLDDVAKYAYDTDLRTSPDMPEEQHIVTHAVYMFEAGDIGDVLLSKTAANGQGQYYRANSAEELTQALSSILNFPHEFAQAASSVAVTAEPVAGSNSMIYIPYFKHETDHAWHGNVRAFGIDEEGLLRDRNGEVAEDTEGGDDLLDSPVWDAEVLLQDRIENGTPRTIFTFTPGTGQIDFTEDRIADIGPLFDCDLNDNGIEDEDTETRALMEYIRGNDTPDGFPDLRDREGHYIGDIIHSSAIYVGPPSANYALYYGDTTYNDFISANSSRTPAIYVGGNDGTLHCFNAETGEELWAYAPYNLLPHLQWLTDPQYCHVYYVDLTCRVWDINFGDEETPNWHSVLIGGFRFGGTPANVDTNDNGTPDTMLRSAVFALDVTDPTKPVPDAANPGKDRNVILWEFAQNNVGYTTSMPVPVRVGDSWYVCFGTGAKTRDGDGDNGLFGGSGDGYTDLRARFFVLNPVNGNVVRSISIGDGVLQKGFRNWFGNPVAVDFDQDYSVDVIYSGDAKGNLWRIKTYDDSVDPKVYREPTQWVIDVGGTNPSAISPQPLVDMSPINERKPFFAKPAVTMDERGRLWVYFGTGRYFCANDNLYCGWGYNCPNLDRGCTLDVYGRERSIFTAAGLYDRHWDDSSQRFVLQSQTIRLEDLDQRLIIEGRVAGGVDPVSGEVLYSYAIVDEAYPDVTIETDVDPDKKGWYFRLLEPKERCLGEFRVYGRVATFLTFNPMNYENDPCLYGSQTSNLYGVYYASGTSVIEPLWDLTGDNTIDAQDLVVLEEANQSVGAGIYKLERGFAGGSPIIRDNMAYLPLGTTVQFADLAGQGSGVTSWRQER